MSRSDPILEARFRDGDEPVLLIRFIKSGFVTIGAANVSTAHELPQKIL